MQDFSVHTMKHSRTSSTFRASIEIIFHTLVCSHHLFLMLWSFRIALVSYNDIIADQRAFGIMKMLPMYFSIWNFIIQITYYHVALYTDIVRCISADNDENLTKIQRQRCYIFSSFLLPLSVFVPIIYWGFYIFDKDLIVPSEMYNHFVPVWLNHGVHTNILIFSIIEVMMISLPLPSFKSGFIGYTKAFVVYHILNFSIYVVSGSWVYKVFYVLTRMEIIVMILSTYLMFVAIHIMGMCIQNYILYHQENWWSAARHNLSNRTEIINMCSTKSE